MDSLILGFSVVFPLISYMVIGYGIKQLGWLSDKTIEEMNKLVFNIFMALVLFLNSYNVEKEVLLQKENIILVGLAMCATVVIIAITQFVCKKSNVTKERTAILLQCVFRSNLALFGLSVNTAIYGEGNSGFLAILIATLIPFYNIVSVVLLANAGVTDKKVSYKKVFMNILKNPLVIASTLGIILTLTEIELPTLILNTIRDLSRVSTPLAFILLGAGIVFGNMVNNKKAIIVASVAKLVIVPLTVITIAVLLGYREQPLVALMCCFASPVAVSTYTMAKDENVAPELAGEVVAVTTAGSIVTIFLFITGLSYFGLM